jgi:hypothetical protein
MTQFSLPLGMFQIQLAGSDIQQATELLREAMERHDKLLDELLERSGQESILASLADHSEEFASSSSRIDEAAEQFKRALATSESPESLPRITTQLIYASIVAGAFHLSFDVIDYHKELRDGGGKSWRVSGRAVDKRGKSYERPGISHGFDDDNGPVSEGALLSACADAFIHCVFAAVPCFPWDRWRIRA